MTRRLRLVKFSLHTVNPRINALGVYLSFRFFTWAFIQGGRLLKGAFIKLMSKTITQNDISQYKLSKYLIQFVRFLYN